MAGAIWVAFSLFLLLLGLGNVALAVFALGAMTAVFVAFSSELTHGSALFRLVRVAVLGSGLRTWIILGLLLAVGLALLWSLGGCLPWFLLVCAGGLAGGYHVFLERPLAVEREKTLGEVRALVRRLRRAATMRRHFVGPSRGRGAGSSSGSWSCCSGTRRCVPRTGHRPRPSIARRNASPFRARRDLHLAREAESRPGVTGAISASCKTPRKADWRPRASTS